MRSHSAQTLWSLDLEMTRRRNSLCWMELGGGRCEWNQADGAKDARVLVRARLTLASLASAPDDAQTDHTHPWHKESTRANRFAHDEDATYHQSERRDRSSRTRQIPSALLLQVTRSASERKRSSFEASYSPIRLYTSHR